MSIYSRYQQKLENIPRPDKGCHAGILGVATLGILAGKTDHEIERDIRSHIPSERLRKRPNEIREQIEYAHRDTEPLATSGIRQPACIQRQAQARTGGRPFPGEEMVHKLVESSRGVAEEDLCKVSPVEFPSEPGGGQAGFLLQSLYQPEEYLFLGHRHSRHVSTVAEWLDALGKVRQVCWPHIIPNPLTGKKHLTKAGKASYRCDAAVAAFRFMLVEFDEMEMDRQLAFWHSVIRQGLLKVAAIIDSGGKSLHAWVAVDLPDQSAWDQYVREEAYNKDHGILTSMGADPQCKNPGRLSRLPDHYRDEKRQFQRLLYLDPEAGKTGGIAPPPCPARTHARTKYDGVTS